MTTLRDAVATWRATHWPPDGMSQLLGLPLYEATYDSAMAYLEKLAPVKAMAADHQLTNCGGHAPRWVHLPSVIFSVDAVNVVQSDSKRSHRFLSIMDWCDADPALTTAEIDCVRAAFSRAEVVEPMIVTHRKSVDLRAMVYVGGGATRHRFYADGLIVVPSPGVAMRVQDHRDVYRKARTDAYGEPLLVTSTSGWAVYVLPSSVVRRQKHKNRNEIGFHVE